MTAFIGALGLASGCGGQTGNPVPMGLTAETRVHRLSGSSGDLIYTTTTKYVAMLSYPQGKLVGTIPWYVPSDDYICSDPNNGNVFIPQGSDANNSHIYEYAHGSTTLLATLSPPAGYTEPTGCTVDPSTGNLAVTVNYGPNGNGAILVYPGGQGAPTPYADGRITYFRYPAYDDSGNLYVRTNDKDGGIRIAELQAGKTDFTLIKFSNCFCTPLKLQWDGTYLVAEDYTQSLQTVVEQFAVSGKTATLESSVVLTGASTRNVGSFWIHGGVVFALLKKIRRNNSQGIGAWPYPSGGDPTAKFYDFTNGRKDFLGDITVSIAPSR